MTDHQNQTDFDSFEVISSGEVTDYDNALLEFGKNTLINSVDTLKNFSQTMITLVSGLFAVYFALLEFLGITNVISPLTMSKIAIALPPVLFILSLISFVLAVLPLYGRIIYKSPSDIEDKRRMALRLKYGAIIAGLVMLVSALAITIFVFLRF
jgi:hypothetical protein